MSIERFRGDNYFLSNMYPLTVWIETIDGIAVPSSEHSYLTNRFVDEDVRKMVAETPDGREAKRLAYQLLEEGAEEVDSWDLVKVGVMQGVVAEKFRRNLDIAEKLVATGDQELVEGNTWGDRFWGVDPVGSRNGRNQLGKILMDLRTTLQIEV